MTESVWLEGVVAKKATADSLGMIISPLLDGPISYKRSVVVSVTAIAAGDRVEFKYGGEEEVLAVRPWVGRSNGYPCGYCSDVFDDLAEYTTHIDRKHPEESPR